MSELDARSQIQLTNSDPTYNQIKLNLYRSNEVAERALQSGHHPFGCVLVAPDNETVLMEQGNIDVVNHAESTLARLAAAKFSPEYLWTCTLYTTFEPCVMCAGTLYWANVGHVVFGVTEKRLLELTGNSKKNPTLDIPCRYVYEHGQKNIKVSGPFPEFENDFVKLHGIFWK